MRKIEKIVQVLKNKFQRELNVEYLPAEHHRQISARITFPARFQLEPVLEINGGRKDFSLSFYILNRKFIGHYGICSDDPCAALRGTYGSWPEDREKLLAHIWKSLIWLDQQTGNDAEIPEERKFDGLSDLLSRLDPEILRYGWYRIYWDRGNWQQNCDIPLRWGRSGSIEMTFGTRHWRLFFELLLQSDEEMPQDIRQFKLDCDYTPENASQIAVQINRAMRWLDYQPEPKHRRET